MQKIQPRKQNLELILLRRKLGFTQMDIGLQTAGVVKATKMSHLEQGYLLPTEEEVKALAVVLKVTEKEIINTFKKDK